MIEPKTVELHLKRFILISITRCNGVDYRKRDLIVVFAVLWKPKANTSAWDQPKKKEEENNNVCNQIITNQWPTVNQTHHGQQ